MTQLSKTFLVLGGTGGTGKHFITLALQDGQYVRALVRTPSKLPTEPSGNLEVVQGSITDDEVDTDRLVKGVDYVIAMLGDREAQETTKICTAFVKKLVPSMRKHGVKRFLYQAGALGRPYRGSLGVSLWAFRNIVARSYDGQHKDNEAVHDYLLTEANDIEWMIHRAGIGGDGPSKGRLERSKTTPNIGTFEDCAKYNYRTIMDESAVHTCDYSCYGK
ncbi:hypothetical protein BAUCODRAFT_75006 [Baudoinia panamericana UAMH 10762]|uniref:NAD(P)-binding domain-containing protein n=1 Tax=Baudoinia panamericana (strain UAMH 10762) TaxID=717646 RepID=M2N4S3_BAUPA|nr:uncharacterized protein BAUCODRAFT_75006 [Baudoinia panamericana UAMH 10762]EMC93994.1 hypothetical protein BAUCODRAFT_75006 [Baudoinia panamericana UAMH 10762]